MNEGRHQIMEFLTSCLHICRENAAARPTKALAIGIVQAVFAFLNVDNYLAIMSGDMELVEQL